MKLSVVIPCYNGAATIGAQLDALAAQKWDEPWEVLVADNGSTDNTREIVTQYINHVPNLRLVDASARKGTSYARNTGIVAAQSDSVAFLDADDVAAPGWVSAIGRAMQKHNFVASRFDYTRLNMAPQQKYIQKNQSDGLQKLWYPPYAYHTGGCGLGITKKLHERVGGFDETLPRLHDTDYCLRVQALGEKLYFVPEALVYIRNRSSLRGVFFQGRTWAKYNTLLYKRYRGEQRIKRPWAVYWRDWYLLAKSLVRRGISSEWIFRFGWQIGLMQGVLAFRSAPAVVIKK